MKHKRHTGIHFQQIAVLIFVLLNCLLTAAPLVHASAINSDSFRNQTNAAEANILNNLSDDQPEWYATVRTIKHTFHQSPATKHHTGNIRIDNRQNWLNDSYPHPERHPFYSFLSIHYLF